MSEASINQVFKRIGYNGKVTGHGFRHTMSTILHEQGYNTAWIETQLAHVDKNSIRGTYNHAQYLDETPRNAPVVCRLYGGVGKRRKCSARNVWEKRLTVCIDSAN